MKVIGLAGETGCGKSTVARELAKEKGTVWVDLDRLSWAIYRPRTPTYSRLVSHYGEGILDCEGAIDRKRLGRIVFSDPEALESLNAIVHPAITDRLREVIHEEEEQGTKTLLVEGALLASSAHVDRKLFDAVIWLEVAPNKRRARLHADGREEQIERTIPPPAGEQVVKIDASGTIEQTVNRIRSMVNPL
ncbi:MAG: dephospho-CoA kinase [Candidatus Bipolaricaulota bacterium]|nr:dephospho-CoA kinase [Candidatus Bipolaricaulota bacterium]